MTEEKFDFMDLEIDQLKAFYQDRKLWVDLKDHIDPNYYNSKDVSKVFQLMKLYFDKYKDFPTKKQLTTLCKKRNMDQDVFRTLDNVFVGGDLAKSELTFLRDESIEFIKNSKMERAVINSVDLIEQKKYQDVHSIITEAVHWDPDIKLGTDYSDAVKRFAKLAELMENIIASPWPRLNEYMGGGFYRKEFYLFAASSSVGKSIALDQISLYAWDKLDHDVVIFTMEMSEERKGQRMDACRFGIPVQNVYNSKDFIVNAFEKENKKNRLFIKEFPQTATTADFEQYLYQLSLYEGVVPSLIVVDYMDIMSPRRNKTGKDYNDQGVVGADLRDMAKMLEIPVVSASQFNRDAMEMSIEDLHEGKIADSWKKMMIADGLIAMSSNPEERRLGILNMKGLKNRNGPKDWILNMRIRYELLKIFDSAQTAKDDAKDRTNQIKEERKEKKKRTKKQEETE